MPVRAVGPSVGIPEVIVIERYPVIIQKIAGPASSRPGQCRFRHHCVPFQKPFVRIYSGQCPVEHFSEDIVERSEAMAEPELHLGRVSGFMYRQHRGPWHRFRSIGRGGGIEIHPFRSPGHRTVRQGAVRVQDDGHFRPCHLPGHVACTAGYRKPVFFKFQNITSGRGIESGRVYDAVCRTFHIRPSDSTGVIAAQKKLC